MLGPVKFFLQLKIFFVYSTNEKMKHRYYTSVNKFSFLGKLYICYMGTQVRLAKTGRLGPFLTSYIRDPKLSCIINFLLLLGKRFMYTC